MNFAVYVITNTVNAKQYVGITNNLSLRWKRHSKADGSSPALHAAIKKYGAKNFVFTHFASAFDWEAACSIERMLIREHNTKAPYGYNLTDGGEGMQGFKHSEETKAKLSESKKGNKHCVGRSGEKHPMFGRVKNKNPMFGMKHTEEAIAKMSKPRSAEARANMAAAWERRRAKKELTE